MLSIDVCPEIPFLNMTDGFRLFYGFYLITISIFGIFANFLLLATILSNRSYFLKIEVFHISISQTITGALYFVAYLTVAVPVILNSYEYVSHLDVMIPLATLDTFTYYTEQGFLMAIATNRFIHMCTKINDLTTFQITKVLHLCAWLFGIFILLIPSLYGCFKIFSPRLLSYTFACGNCGDVYRVYTLTSEIIPGSLLVIYTIIVFRIQLIKKDLSMNLSLTIQFLFISMPSLIGSICFFFIFNWFPGNAYVGIVPMTLSGIIMFANPLVLFAFNDTVKRSMLSLIYGRRRIEEATRTSISRRRSTITPIHP